MNAINILIGKRKDSAVKVQELLTKNGDMIKTRLGIHHEPGCENPASGFVFLEVVGTEERIGKLCDDLNAIENVTAKNVTLNLSEFGCNLD